MRTTRMDQNEIHVIDDVISSPYQDLIEKKVLSNEFSYYFEADIGHIDNRGGGNFGFGNTVRDNGKTLSSLDLLFQPMIHESLHKIGRKVAYIRQGRIFMITSGTPEKQDVYHVDVPTYHIVVLYYVIDSDGDTILTDKIHDEKLNPENLNYSSFFEPNQLKPFKKITPKKGRVVMFNGLRYHCSSRPSKGIRAVVNYNVL